MKNILTIALASAALIIPGVAIADQQGKRGPQGDVTLAQVQERTAERFAKLDMDGNGHVTKAELEAHRQQRKDQRFARMDADGNGAITQEEMEAHKQVRAAERGERKGKRGGKRGMRAMGGGFDRLDTNNDGSVSLAEFQARPMERFEMADADGNGVVTEAERKEARSKMREQRREMRGQR